MKKKVRPVSVEELDPRKYVSFSVIVSMNMHTEVKARKVLRAELTVYANGDRVTALEVE